MNLFNIPKGAYKMQKAKNQMSKIDAIGVEKESAVLWNGINEVVEIHIDADKLLVKDQYTRDEVKRMLSKIQDDIRKAANNAKQQVDKKIVSSTSQEDLMKMLGM